MPNRASISIGNERRALQNAERFWVKENSHLKLAGLDPGSPVGVRLEGDDRFAVRLHADESGIVEGNQPSFVTRRLGVAMRAGEAFEIRCYVQGAPVDFVVEMEHHRFTAAEIVAMLADLGAMDLQWDATSPIPTRVGDLEQRVGRLVSTYPALSDVARSIVARPDEVLDRMPRLVPVRDARRLSPTDVRVNLTQRRLDGRGRPLGTAVLDTVNMASVDTPANAYVKAVIESMELYAHDLKRQVALEDRRLANEAERERSYRTASTLAGRAERTTQELRQQLKRFQQQLDSLQFTNLPPSWGAFRSRPDRTSNAVRFDPRFTKFTRLTSEIMDRRSEAARTDRLQRIADFGRRPHSEIYEVWVVCKAFEAIYKLGFRTPSYPKSVDHREAFLRLEKPSGAVYGLRKDEPVELVHKDAPHIYIRIAYEPMLTDKNTGQVGTPDVVLVLRGSADVAEKSPAKFGGERYGASPLYFDAKYQMRSVLEPRGNKDYVTKYVRLATSGGTRRPHSFVVQAAPDGFAWTQRKREGDESSASQLGLDSDALFPYRAGVVSMSPVPVGEDSSLVARMPLVRVIYAWLVVQGLIAICPRCGGVLRRRAGTRKTDPVTGLCADTFKPYLPSPESVVPNPSKHSLDCEECKLGVTANYCGSCRRQGVFVPIIKVYPRSDQEQEALTSQWVSDYEIAEPSDVHWARHCPRCGSR